MFNKKNILPAVVLFFLTVSFVIFFYIQYRSIIDHEKDLTNQKTKVIFSVFDNFFKQGNEASAYLYSTPPISGILNAQRNSGYDEAENTSYSQWISRLSRIFKGVVDNESYIRQIRYLEISDDGRELLRVQRNHNGIAYDNHILQSKNNEPYYRGLKSLKNNKVYIFPPEWNREFGHVEVPKWITVRIVFPVFDKDKVKYALVTNLDFSHLLTSISKDKDVIFSVYYKGKELYSGFSNDNSSAFLEEKYNIPNSSINLDVKVEFRKAIITRSIINLFIVVIIMYLASIGVIFGLYFYFKNIVNRLNEVNMVNDRYKALVENSSEILILFNRFGVIVEANPSAHFHLDLSKNDLFDSIGLGKGELRKKTLEDVDEYAFSKIEFYSTINRNIYSGVINKFFLSNKKGNEEYYLLVAHDITEQRENENKIYDYNARLESQVEARTKELVLANQEAQKANIEKSKFLANVSHEIRTPLNGVSGMLTLLHESNVSNEQRQYLTMASTSIQTLSILINDLLDLSKIESGVIELENEQYNVIEQVEEVVRSFSIRANEKGLNLLFYSNGFAELSIRGDSLRCRQIVTNLIGNALKFTNAGSVCVDVSLDTLSNRVLISVIDTGIGISKESIDKIFIPFRQADSSTTRKFGGTGLGLSVSRELCTLMGGALSCQSELGKGATFTASLKIGDREELKTAQFSSLLNSKKVALQHCDELVSLTLKKYVESLGGEFLSKECLASYGSQADIQMIEYSAKHCDGSQITGPCLFIVNSLSAPLELKDEHVLSAPITPFSFQQSLCLLLDLHEQKSDVYTYEVEEQAHIEPILTDIPFIIVDDNSVNLVVASGLLSSIASNIETASNGEEALEKVKAYSEQGRIPIVLMDCQMPVMDGFEATGCIRRGEAGENAKETIIIALTAGAMESDRQACFSAGMDSFISKPLDARKFREQMRKYIDIYQTKFVIQD